MAKVVVCDRCGKRLDGSLDRQAGRHVAKLELASIGGREEIYEIDLCELHAQEVLAEFTSRPFLDSIEGVEVKQLTDGKARR